MLLSLPLSLSLSVSLSLSLSFFPSLSHYLALFFHFIALIYIAISHTILWLLENVDVGTPIENVQNEVGSREQLSTHPAIYELK